MEIEMIFSVQGLGGAWPVATQCGLVIACN